MIRRWSCIITINHAIEILKRFHRVIRLKLLKKAIKARRVYLHGTRFRRRQLMRIKHHTNWMVYLNIWKYWTDDLRISRQFARFQYFHRAFVNNYIMINAASWKASHRQVTMLQDQWIGSTMTQKLSKALSFGCNTYYLKQRYKNNYYTNGFFPTEDIEVNFVTAACTAEFDNASYYKNYEDFSILDETTFWAFEIDLVLSYHVEFYKIFSCLWYHQIGKIYDMSLPRFSLRKLPFTSSASRKVYYFRPRKLLFWKCKQLSLYSKWNAGRNDSGRTVVWTKSSILKKVKSIRINYNFQYNYSGFISHYQFIPVKNKVVSLVHYANGGLSYFLTTTKHRLFSFFYLYTDNPRDFPYSSTVFTALTRISKLARLCLIEMVPGRGAQYCRSAGSKGRIIKFDINTISALIFLPSGSKKLFSYNSFAAIGYVRFKKHRKFFNSKAGFWRSFGHKPTVRGVAMNPVDHPHGGRTKAIQHQRTPWGKTTKLK